MRFATFLEYFLIRFTYLLPAVNVQFFFNFLLFFPKIKCLLFSILLIPILLISIFGIFRTEASFDSFNPVKYYLENARAYLILHGFTSTLLLISSCLLAVGSIKRKLLHGKTVLSAIVSHICWKIRFVSLISRFIPS